MTTVILEVRTPDDVMADFANAWKTAQPQQDARIGFATPELLWKVLTAKRWQLLKALCSAGPVSIREAARLVGRDVKAVHGDVVRLFYHAGQWFVANEQHVEPIPPDGSPRFRRV